MKIDDAIAIMDVACDLHSDEVSETWDNMLGLWQNHPYLDPKFKGQLEVQMIKIGMDIENGIYD